MRKGLVLYMKNGGGGLCGLQQAPAPMMRPQSRPLDLELLDWGRGREVAGHREDRQLLLGTPPCPDPGPVRPCLPTSVGTIVPILQMRN